MAYNDTNPERKNLTVLSLSIILFYLAGGEFLDSAVRLQVINVKFTKPEILIYFTWGLLFWFCYRYWLIHQGSWKKGYFQEMTSGKVPIFIYYRYLKHKFALGNDYSRSYHQDRHWLKLSNQGNTKIVFQHIYKNDSEGQLTETKEIKGILDRFLMFVCTLYILFRMPSLSNYFVPYVLFVVAIILGIKGAL